MDSVELGRVFHKFNEINFARIAVIIAGALILTALIKRGFPWVARRMPGRIRFYILPLVPIFRIIILAIAVLAVIPLIVKPTAQNFLAVFGALGLAIGFAFKDYVSGILAGIVVLYEQPYRPGDWVTIDGDYGEIESMGLRSFRMVTPDDTVVTIPHAKLWNANIHNANDGKREHLCVADFYLHPEHDAGRVRRKLIDVALTSPYLQIKRPIQAIVREKPWGTHYRLKAYPIDGRDEFLFVSDLTVRGKAALGELGVAWAPAPAAVPEAQ